MTQTTPQPTVPNVPNEAVARTVGVLRALATLLPLNPIVTGPPDALAEIEGKDVPRLLTALAASLAVWEKGPSKRFRCNGVVVRAHFAEAEGDRLTLRFRTPTPMEKADVVALLAAKYFVKPFDISVSGFHDDPWEWLAILDHVLITTEDARA